VNAILTAVQGVARGRPVRVWSTDGRFLTADEARNEHLKVAAANWHALATFAGRFASADGGLLLDVGSTTTDVIPLHHGVPSTYGTTDWQRMRFRELVYVGVRRTPVCAVVPDRTMAELFATTQDVFVFLGLLPEDPTDRETADGRPLTRAFSRARLARMLGGDAETIPEAEIGRLAALVHRRIVDRLADAVRDAYYCRQSAPELKGVIVSGSGSFLALQVVREVLDGAPVEHIVALNDRLGPAVSACAPAYALAVLASERPV
jgi:probable H4MPT-linked C1 transfer pathway protein